MRLQPLNKCKAFKDTGYIMANRKGTKNLEEQWKIEQMWTKTTNIREKLLGKFVKWMYLALFGTFTLKGF